jgi:hypothetical protein
MTTIPNADSWMDVITILLAVAMMSVPSWFAIKAHRTSSEVLSQTRNGHSVPLRADLDKAIAAIESLAADIKNLRADVVLEESRRRSQIEDLASDVDRMRRRP